MDESTVAARDARRVGLVMVLTGDGKGKTTAALGLGLRAAGHDMRVLMIQFIKNKWRSGEIAAIERLAPQFTIHRRGEGFTWRAKDDGEMERHRAAALEALALAREALTTGVDVLILDEVCTAIKAGLLDAGEVVALVHEKPSGLHLVLTGRGAPEVLIECADTVTELREVKHHYHRGIKAQRGIEF